jgi:hypothetical protein
MQNPDAGGLLVARPSLRRSIDGRVLLRIQAGICLESPARSNDVYGVDCLTINYYLLWYSVLGRLGLGKAGNGGHQ